MQMEKHARHWRLPGRPQRMTSTDAWPGRGVGPWRSFVAALILAACTSGATRAAELTRFSATQPHMGVQVRLQVYADDEALADRAFAAAFDRIEELNRLLSDYDAASELSQLSATAPHESWAPVSADLYRVLDAAQQTSRDTDGAFDVTVGALSRLWRRARRKGMMPDEGSLHAARATVGYRHLLLNQQRRAARLQQSGTRLDLGGIAKGYVADQALEELCQYGCPRASVDTGGDLSLGDPPPGERGWRIGISPLEPDQPASRFVRVSNCGVATSGDAWQFVEIDDVRYSHLLDPHTGLGLTTRSSVTVIAHDCMTADALASAVSVLGPRAGTAFVERTCGVDSLVVAIEEGEVQTFESSGFSDW